jgi:hypothetical protein
MFGLANSGLPDSIAAISSFDLVESAAARPAIR